MCRSKQTSCPGGWSVQLLPGYKCNYMNDSPANHLRNAIPPNGMTDRDCLFGSNLFFMS